MNIRRLSFALLLLSFSLFAPASRADEIDDYIRAEMTRQQVPGLTLGIIRDGKLIRKQAYGVADLELDVKTTPDMLFEIGSATKSFTAMAVMMLVEEGKLGLDDPVSRHLEKLPETWTGITIRQLLNHTSGLPEYATFPEFTITEDVDRDKMIAALGKMPLDFQPGSAFSYTNTGFYLLGMTIERLSGKPYDQFLKERILTPLGMTSTRDLDPNEIIPGRAGRYFMAGPRRINSKPTQLSSAFSAGLLLSNVEDMAKWDAALREKKLLKPSSYDAMWTPLRLPSGASRGYGFGWFLSKMNGHRVVYHYGNSAGYGGTITRFPDDNLTIIVLLNLYPVNADSIARGVASRILPALKPVAPQEQADPDPARTEKLKKALAGLAEGKMDAESLAPELIVAYSTSRGKMMQAGLKPLASAQSYAYAGMEKEGVETTYAYRVALSNRKLTVRFITLPDGKITAISAQPD